MNSKIILNHINQIKNMLPIKKINKHKNEICLFVDYEHIFFVLFFLKNFCLSQYTILTSITAVDYTKKKYRFEIVYSLLSVRYNNRINIKICVNELTKVQSCEKIYSAANWFECEVFDMYGIFFFNSSNLKRILTDYGFEGYPLRKDFPLSGFVEVRYDEKNKKVVNEFLELTQEYRVFDFQTPWKNF